MTKIMLISGRKFLTIHNKKLFILTLFSLLFLYKKFLRIMCWFSKRNYLVLFIK